MREMNASLYERTCLAQSIIVDIVNQLGWHHIKKHVVAACAVLPYSSAYLQTCIAHTIEWRYIEQMHQLLGDTKPFTAYEQPVQLLAFLHRSIVQQKTCDTSFLDPSLKLYCTQAYEKYSVSDRAVSPFIKANIQGVETIIARLSLTAREKEIMRFIVQGFNNHEVATRLNISVHTVKNHVTNIFKKLDVSDRIQAMTKIYRMQFE